MTLNFYARAPEHDEGAFQTLFNNLPLILKHKDLILCTPEYHNIYLKGAGVFGLYIGSHSLLLGELLILWEKKVLKTQQGYFVYLFGSPLSGMNSSKCWNETEGLHTATITPFTERVFKAISLIQNGDITPKKNYTFGENKSELEKSSLTEKYRVKLDNCSREYSPLTIDDLVQRLKRL